MDAWNIPESISFGTLVQKGREDKGLSREQLSQLCGGLDIAEVEEGRWVPSDKHVRLLIRLLSLDEVTAEAVARRDLINHPEYPEEGRKILLNPSLTPEERLKRFKEHFLGRLDKLIGLYEESAAEGLPLPDLTTLKEDFDALKQQERHRDS